MEELFRRFLDDQQSNTLNPIQASAYVLLMLLEMQRTRRERGTNASTSHHASRADEFIKTHFHEPIGTAEIAAKLRLNPDYLGRLYRQAYGMNLTDAVRSRRLKYARELLMHSDANIGEIAAECGFALASYFRRIFRNVEGISPSAWRRIHGRLHANTA